MDNLECSGRHTDSPLLLLHGIAYVSVQHMSTSNKHIQNPFFFVASHQSELHLSKAFSPETFSRVLDSGKI